MTDEETNHKRYGTKINKEEEGFTEIEYNDLDVPNSLKDKAKPHPYKYIAKPKLKIPKTALKGRRRLIAVYTDERQKINKSSLARTTVIYGSKCYVHCPTIFQPTTEKEIKLTANIFSNNRPVSSGNAQFGIMRKVVSKDKIAVEKGYVEETHTKKFTDPSLYECYYLGDEVKKIDIGEGEGRILPYTDYKTPLTVEVMKVITNYPETCPNSKGGARLIARVYHTSHGNVVKYDSDVPKTGTITFHVDGIKMGKITSLDKNGFAWVNLTEDHKEILGVGVHNIIATYDPDTDEMIEKYQSTSGANTLFIGDDTNKPCLTQVGKNCGAKDEEYVFKFNSNKALNGRVAIFLDGTAIHCTQCTSKGKRKFMGNSQNQYEMTVSNVTSFQMTITIPSYDRNVNETVWGYAGNHNMMIQYIQTDEELGDIEYWYYWSDFYIQSRTLVFLDDTYIDNTSDGSTYTGNNMYLIENNETVHFTPTTTQIPKSVVGGNPLIVRVENDDGGKIDGGTVKLKVTTRKKETWVN